MGKGNRREPNREGKFRDLEEVGDLLELIERANSPQNQPRGRPDCSHPPIVQPLNEITAVAVPTARIAPQVPANGAILDRTSIHPFIRACIADAVNTDPLELSTKHLESQRVIRWFA